MIDRQPAIDSSSSAGARPASCEGSIVFSGVGFSYPSRREVTILDTFNLDIQAGAKVGAVISAVSTLSVELETNIREV